MKRVLITGGSGFVGKKLVAALQKRGDLVTVLTRSVARAKRSLPDGVRVASWDPAKEGAWFDEVNVVDVVVHLAGEPVIRRWSDEGKRAIEQSRVGSAKLLVEAIGRAKDKPSALISASAIGYYGHREGSVSLDESAPAGSDFLAGVVKSWEAAVAEADQHGLRTAMLRIGIVLGEDGGALEQMARPFKLFAGGPIGDGKQVYSWVHRDDVVGMFLLAIDSDEVRGPLNVVSPNAVTSKEMADAIGIVLGRPSWISTPKAVLAVGLGEAANVLTTGQRVVPARAIELGYEFHYARLLPALESALGG